MKTIQINAVQADIIYKALHYTVRNEGLHVAEDLQNVFEVLAEYNPADTHINDCIDVMDSLSGFIMKSEPYAEYLTDEEDEI